MDSQGIINPEHLLPSSLLDEHNSDNESDSSPRFNFNENLSLFNEEDKKDDSIKVIFIKLIINIKLYFIKLQKEKTDKNDSPNSKNKEKINSNLSEKIITDKNINNNNENDENLNKKNLLSKIIKENDINAKIDDSTHVNGITKINEINIFPPFNSNNIIKNNNINSFNNLQTKNCSGIKNNNNFNNINIINNDNSFPSFININKINNINNENIQQILFSKNQINDMNKNSFENYKNNMNNNINTSGINKEFFSKGNYFQNNITNINNINNINIENLIQNINTDFNKNCYYKPGNNNNEMNNNYIFNEIEQLLKNVNALNLQNNEKMNFINNKNYNKQNLNKNFSPLFFNKKKNGKKKNNLFNTNNFSKENNKEKDIRDFKRFCEGLKCSLPDYICSQIGSRIMQKYLTRFPSFIITNLIEKIYIYFEKMMCDVYGNYFCQKLYNISSIEQRRMILNSIKDIFINVSKTTAGAHVSQSIIEQSSTKEEKSIIMSYINGHEMELALHQEGTHVLQKIIQIFPEKERQSLTDALCTNLNVNILCQDLKGISVIKRLISFNTEQENKIKLVESFFGNCLEISKTSSGSYIIQYLLEQWGIDVGLKLIFYCITNFELFASSKHSANLIDKIIIICLKRYSIIRYFGNENSMNIINNEIIIINALKNVILEPNKIINVYKNKYGKALIIKIRKLLSAEENEKLYLFIKSLEAVPNYLESKKYKIYIEIFSTQ